MDSSQENGETLLAEVTEVVQSCHVTGIIESGWPLFSLLALLRRGMQARVAREQDVVQSSIFWHPNLEILAMSIGFKPSRSRVKPYILVIISSYIIFHSQILRFVVLHHNYPKSPLSSIFMHNITMVPESHLPFLWCSHVAVCRLRMVNDEAVGVRELKQLGVRRRRPYYSRCLCVQTQLSVGKATST